MTRIPPGAADSVAALFRLREALERLGRERDYAERAVRMTEIVEAAPEQVRAYLQEVGEDGRSRCLRIVADGRIDSPGDRVVGRPLKPRTKLPGRQKVSRRRERGQRSVGKGVPLLRRSAATSEDAETLFWQRMLEGGRAVPYKRGAPRPFGTWPLRRANRTPK